MLVLDFPLVQVLADFTSSSGPPSGLSAAAIALDTGDGRGVARGNIARGRAYELAGVQASSCSVEVDDPRETLNPANPASPLATAGNTLALYRSIGVRAWWPRTGNMLDPRTYKELGFDPGFEAIGVTNGWSSPGGTVTNVATAPLQGARCLQLVLPGPSASATSWAWHTFPGRTHTYSVWVRRDATSPGSSITLTAGGASSTSTSSTAFTRLSVTFVAATAQTAVTLTAAGGATGAATQTVYLDCEQLELGATASAWSATGSVRYALWTGYIERYPQQWVDAGYRGVRPLECVDSLSVLARTVIGWSYDETIRPDAPNMYMPLDDPAGPGTVRGPLSGIVDLTAFVAPKGGSISWRGGTNPDGTPAVVLSQQLQNTADTPLAEQYTELDTRSDVGPSPTEFAIDTHGATIEFWVKIDSSVCRLGVQSVTNGNFHPNFVTEPAFFAGLNYRGAGSHQTQVAVGTTYNDNGFYNFDNTDWHLWAIVFDSSKTDPSQFTVTHFFDDKVYTSGVTSSHRQFGINSVHIDTRTIYGDPLSKASFARLAIYNSALSADRIKAHYLRGIGNAGETAEARATRLLTTYWSGPFIVRSGSGLTMPGDFGYSGGSVLAGLEDVVGSDEGLVIADGEGRPVVESRLTRHSQTTALCTFGEDAAAGELPYEAVEYGFDPNYVYSRVSLTRPGRQDPVVLVDAAVEAMIGPQVFSKTLSVDTDAQLEQAAKFYLHRYGQARMRIEKLTLSPAANPTLWPVVLGLDISVRVRVKRRTATGAVMDGEFYVESIKHDFDIESGSWSVALELSPVFVPSAWVLGDATHGVLGSTTVPIY